MTREELGSSNATQLKRLVLRGDKSLIGRAPRRLHEWRSLVFLHLVGCNDTGPVLELGGLNSLRVLSVKDCYSLERIVCSCGNDYDDQMCCYKRKPGWGCMSELMIVRVSLYSHARLKDLLFLKHCPNLQVLEVSTYSNYFPTTFEPIDLGHLKALRTLSIRGRRHMIGYDVAKWLLAALQLENLTVLEYQSFEEYWDFQDCGYTLDLNQAVHLSSRLEVLALQLPKEIKEVKGLHLLSELTALILRDCLGLEQLTDLRELPKLKWICVRSCCMLEGPLCPGPEVQGIGWVGRFFNAPSIFKRDSLDDCLQRYCNDGQDCSQCRWRSNMEVVFKYGKDEDRDKMKRLFPSLWLLGELNKVCGV